MSATIRGGTSGAVLDVDTTSKAAKVVLYDSAGHAISTSSSGSDYYLKAATSQDIDVMAGNSSTANLAAGASFTGASESNLNTAAIQIMFYADQPCTIQLQQSTDGLSWTYFVDTYYTAASYSDCRTFVAKGAYMRVIVTNTGGSPTTTLILQTVAVPVSNPLTFRDGVAIDYVQKTTYRAAFSGALVTGAIMTLKGSATKLIVVTRIGFGASSTAYSSCDVSVQKCTGVTSGTPAAMTAVPMDSKSPAATAVVQSWAGGAPTLTATGKIYAASYQVGKGGDALPFENHVVQFGALPPITSLRLRGTSEWVALVFTAATGSTAADVWIEWCEE